MTGDTLSTIAVTLAVVSLLVLLAVGTAFAKNRMIQECHPALVFPRESCRMYNGGWSCSGSAVETKMCYHVSERNPR